MAQFCFPIHPSPINSIPLCPQMSTVSDSKSLFCKQDSSLATHKRKTHKSTVSHNNSLFCACIFTCFCWLKCWLTFMVACILDNIFQMQFERQSLILCWLSILLECFYWSWQIFFQKEYQTMALHTKIGARGIVVCLCIV